ncbi:hypothetical protein ACKLNO_05515 [Neisseriaceae bacterium B1]
MMQKIPSLIISSSLFFIAHHGYAKNIQNKEKIVFKCELKNRSTIQITHKTINNIDYFTYENIKNGRTQIQLTQSKARIMQNSVLPNSPHSLNFRGNGVNMFFPNGAYGYNVYSSFHMPDNENEKMIFRDGVKISKGDNSFPITMECQKREISLSDELFIK